MVTRIVVVCLTLVVCLFPCSARGGDAAKAVDWEKVFPALEGWTPDGEPEVFYPETLFEYINGAAEVYLTYSFEELGALTYDKGEKQSLTIDIYRHKDLPNGFGIYGAERPPETDFLSIGTQGYYAKGILNFFKGPYYVKVMGYYLGDDDESTLKSIATEVAGKLQGEEGFPKMLSVFPEEGKVANSEKFIAKYFLGHGFLHTAYQASYDLDGQKLDVFIIEAKDAAEATEMLDKYFELVKSKDGKVEGKEGAYKFVDPRRQSAGPANIRVSDRYIWGLFTGDGATAGNVLAAVETNLTEAGLIE